jgi:hypothetical protein
VSALRVLRTLRSMLWSWAVAAGDARHRGASMCTFVLVKQVNGVLLYW